MEGIRAVVLAPTRELAVQISTTLKELITKQQRNNAVSVVVLTGGISKDKQTRLLENARGFSILVATPGRLWDFCEEDKEMLKKIKFFVLDEADRMLQDGHFRELEQIIDVLPSKKNEEAIKEAEIEDKEIKKKAKKKNRSKPNTSEYSIYLFSATLTATDLTQNLNKTTKKDKDLMKMLLERLPLSQSTIFLDTERKYLPSTLVQEYFECLDDQKELILYHLIQKNPVKFMVFLNSITAIKYLAPLLRVLQIKVWAIHSELDQKKRLQAIEAFTLCNDPCARVLLTTDVSARGIDTLVDIVVQYHVPRSLDAYIHRSGRTARNGKEGRCVTLIAPSEASLWQKVVKKTPTEQAVSKLKLDLMQVDALKPFIKDAKQREKKEHLKRKKSQEMSWKRKMAEEAGIELSESESDGESGNQKRNRIR